MISSYVKITGKKLSAKHDLVLKAADRAYWGSSLGTYYLCGLAYTDASAQIVLKEQKFSNTYSVQNGQLFTMQLLPTTSTIFNFAAAELLSQSISLNLEVGLYDPTNTANNLTLSYQLCTGSTCSVANTL